jgi:sugar O-acyltransferase (sialic acid O-acetyltransferase NeuD family)
MMLVLRTAMFGLRLGSLNRELSRPVVEGEVMQRSIEPIWILGAGGHAKVVIEAIRAGGEFEICGILDDNIERHGTTIRGIPIVDSMTSEAIARHQVRNAVIAIGDNRTRARLASELGGLVSWPAVIHPRAIVDSASTLGEGTVVCAGAVVQTDTRIGQHAILNTACSVDHDCDVGDFAHIAPGCHIAGGVQIGDGVLVGIGSSIIPGRGIGNWAIVGAGAVVVANLPASCVATGVPARVTRRIDGSAIAPATPRSYATTAKRAFDFGAAFIGAVLLAPVWLLVAILILATMGRPIFFKQPRPGRDSEPFTILKFRTMRDAIGADGQLLSDAERLTAFGSFLRKLSLDEIPQLLNVLRGDLSLVGPRPLLMQYLPLYSPEQARRHNVRPGITGWAQVNGRNSLDWNEKFALDVWYVDNWSLRLDLRILFRTIFKVFRRDGISAAGVPTMTAFTGGVEEPAA